MRARAPDGTLGGAPARCADSTKSDRQHRTRRERAQPGTSLMANGCLIRPAISCVEAPGRRPWQSANSLSQTTSRRPERSPGPRLGRPGLRRSGVAGQTEHRQLRLMPALQRLPTVAATSAGDRSRPSRDIREGSHLAVIRRRGQTAADRGQDRSWTGTSARRTPLHTKPRFLAALTRQ